MDLGLAGKVAIGNGTSQGIVCDRPLFAEEGARVAMTARRAPALDAAVERIRGETGGDVVAVRGDLRKADDCACIVAEAVAACGRLDILVNNDGAPPLGPSLEFRGCGLAPRGLTAPVASSRAPLFYLHDRRSRGAIAEAAGRRP